MTFSKSQRERFRENLILLSPPAIVLEKFDYLCYLCDERQFEDRLEDLLKDACRMANWTVPWEPEGVRLTFKAKVLDHDHPEFKKDVGGENTPGEEQCYRRGFVHGFVAAKQKVEPLTDAISLLEPMEREIWRWRAAELHDRSALFRESIEEPDYPCKIRSTLRRSGLSPKKTFRCIGTRQQKMCDLWHICKRWSGFTG
ncbi:hypothetical protein QO034_10860 [Sedimentitalea sp. JM2-8]|uniref:Uncharacterized protein n=1 Tax=Sedimentitalea xiamensis TaxID=3050037 RepID=A0ABT7FEQ7_9RHOB|nr:hypothetical protein [Sedimentitalea xiamensis]MDK3073612.1 hypothetical protein [Sedimentitalea xiamensis]